MVRAIDWRGRVGWGGELRGARGIDFSGARVGSQDAAEDDGDDAEEQGRR